MTVLHDQEGVMTHNRRNWTVLPHLFCVLPLNQCDSPNEPHCLCMCVQMINLEPEKRIDVDAALKHPFVRDVLPKRKEAKDKQRKQT